MNSTLFSLLAFVFFITPTFASLQNARRSPHSGALQRKRNWSHFTNKTEFIVEDPAELVKRDGTKYVFMHHIVGSKVRVLYPVPLTQLARHPFSADTYSFTVQDWKDDIQQIQAKGVDALALNIGRDDWHKEQVANAYEAAKQLGSGFKLFQSFDFTQMDCNLDDFISRTNTFGGHPNQFKVNGKTFISSFSGDCLGNSGWGSLKAATNGYVMPFIWGLENQFNSWTNLDSWYCWGCAWPNGNQDKTTADDYYYINQLGSRYATAVSMWMYAHYPYKNMYQRGDNWLIVNRWEQIVSMRNSLTFVEMVTWNDFGESDYFGPVRGAQPDGTTWATGFPHTAWFDLSQYYITAFKTGSYPPITKDVIYFWARPHPAGASASGDGIGKPTGWDWTEDTMWAAVYATSPANVTLKCGVSQSQFNVNAGVNKLKIPLSPGKMTVQMSRNGQTIIDYTPNDYAYITNPIKYNYNAWVGSATANGSLTIPSTSTTKTFSTPAPTSTVGQGFTSLGCYQDDSSRILAVSQPTDSSLTVAKCLARCSGLGYTYAGVEYGNECYCGSSLRSNAVKAPQNECNMNCAGKSDEKCGDGYRINVYQASSTLTSTPTPGPTPTPSGGWSPLGCVAEGTTGSRRALTAASYTQSNMTPQLCQNLCSSYKYAGVEYGVECYCGDSLANNGATGNFLISSTSCQMNCGGDSTQKCGDSWTMNVYSKIGTSTQWTSAGCYIDANSRILRGSNNRLDTMTTETCIAMCTSGGYPMAATEDGKECWCGSQFFREGSAGGVAGAGQCSTPCGGNSAQTCGGGWRANLYLKPGTTI